MTEKVWITRDKGCFVSDRNVYIWHGEIKPISHGRHGEIDYDVGQKHELCSLTISQFKALFGFTPRKGFCKLYEMKQTLTPI